MLNERPVARPNDDVCLAAGQPGTDDDTILPVAEQQTGNKATPARRRAWLPAPRTNEEIGGGYFIFRRGRSTGRIKTGYIKHGKVPFEHPNHHAALTEAKRLADLYGGDYDIVGRVATIHGGPLKAELSTSTAATN